MENVSRVKMHGGWQEAWQHDSTSCQCRMQFSIYLPPQAEQGKPLPVLYWLSGLTCTDENFTTKAGAQRYAAEHGLVLVMPDTSPRGDDVPDDPESAWDFGLGAGFYLNATQAPWDKHYKMYDYITQELPAIIEANFPVDTGRKSISGHSMGGHGALTIALKNSDAYQSVSAFSPIVAPMQCPWGEKAFSNYLGEEKSQWKAYDAVSLISEQGKKVKSDILIDQGLADNFLEEQLLSYKIQQACDQVGQGLNLRMQPDYDHSYYFIASFIEEHIAFHAKALGSF